MNQNKTLVIGASGTVGSELIRLLNQAGHKTLAATSDKKKVKEGTAYINLATGEGVREAIAQVDKLFILSPPGYADQYQLVSPLIQEAKRRSLKKVVLMTAMGANAVETSPFRRAEVELEKSGLNYNIIRPNWFMQNFNTFWIQGINQHHKILLPAGSAQVSFIDARDISSVAAQLLQVDEHNRAQLNNKDFDLTGAEAIDHHQVAHAISQVTGQKIVYQDIEPIELKNALLAVGLNKDYVDFLIMIFGFLKEGYSARTTTAVYDITNQKPRDITQYAQDYKNSWR